MSVGSSPVSGCKCQSPTSLSIPLSYLPWSGLVSRFLVFDCLCHHIWVQCPEDFPSVGCTLDEFVFIFYRLIYKLTIKRSSVVFLLKKPISCHSALGGVAHFNGIDPLSKSCMSYVLFDIGCYWTVSNFLLSFLIRKETILRKLLCYALIQDDEFDSLANFKNSYLTCVLNFVARQIW